MPGEANDISVGGDGRAWIIGTKPEAGAHLASASLHLAPCLVLAEADGH